MSPVQGPPLIVAEGAGAGDVELRCVPGAAGCEQVRRLLPSLAPGQPVPAYDDWD